MHDLPQNFSLHAALLFSPHQRPEADVWVNVRDGKITGVGAAEEAAQFELGDCALLPGLINAHAHLEFSDLETPLGQKGIPLADWIGEVFSWRASTARKTSGERLTAGVIESLKAGVVAVADIVTEGELPTDPPLHYLAHQELIATGDGQIDTVLEVARRCAAAKKKGLVQCGLSPHAPYSVAERVWEEVVPLAVAHNLSLTVHLAETRDELAFLSTGTGPFQDLLRQRGANDFVPAGKSPLDFLQLLATAPRVLIAHGNYLTEEEIAFVAAHRTQFTVVYCPRTHTYFGHAPYPLESMLEAGINVALGTDGRGSNPDLNLWGEMRHVAATFPELSGETVLQMGTLAGAVGLRLADQLGTIEAGKEASLAVIRLTEDRGIDPYARLFHRNSAVVATLIAGRLIAGTLGHRVL